MSSSTVIITTTTKNKSNHITTGSTIHNHKRNMFMTRRISLSENAKWRLWKQEWNINIKEKWWHSNNVTSFMYLRAITGSCCSRQLNIQGTLKHMCFEIYGAVCPSWSIPCMFWDQCEKMKWKEHWRYCNIKNLGLIQKQALFHVEVKQKNFANVYVAFIGSSRLDRGFINNFIRLRRGGGVCSFYQR